MKIVSEGAVRKVGGGGLIVIFLLTEGKARGWFLTQDLYFILHFSSIV